MVIISRKVTKAVLLQPFFVWELESSKASYSKVQTTGSIDCLVFDLDTLLSQLQKYFVLSYGDHNCKGVAIPR